LTNIENIVYGEVLTLMPKRLLRLHGTWFASLNLKVVLVFYSLKFTMRPCCSKTFINSSTRLIFLGYIGFGKSIIEMADYPTIL
jgi:hypothetical protein